MKYFLWLILISILIVNSYLAFKTKETFKGYYRYYDNYYNYYYYSPPLCDSIQTYRLNLDEFKYIKCIGLMNNEYKEQFNSKNIPFYHIHKSFKTIQEIVTTTHLELQKIYGMHQKTGPCFILISKIDDSRIDTFILFPNISKDLSLINIPFNLAKCHRWIYLNIYHPYNNSNYSNCGLLTKPEDRTKVYPNSKNYNTLQSKHIFDKANSSGYLFNIPFSQCNGSPVEVKYDANYKEGYYYYGCQGRYIYNYKNCGCSSGCSANPNLDYNNERKSPAQNKHFMVYTPNTNHTLFNRYGSQVETVNRSYLIEGQRVTKQPYTFIVSENNRFIVGLDNNGFYLRDTQANNTKYIKNINLSNDSELVFSGDTLSLSNSGVVVWNKVLVPQGIDSRSPYVFQLTNTGNFSVWDINGNRLFI
jgi:hypothetical protein